MEQKLKVVEIIKGDKVYNNIDLRELDVDNYIIVEKIYAEGMKFPSKFTKRVNGKDVEDFTYSIGIKYLGENCSAWISSKQHEDYKDCGGVGDKVKISKYKAEVKVKAGDLLVKRLKFEKVE